MNNESQEMGAAAAALAEGAKTVVPSDAQAEETPWLINLKAQLLKRARASRSLPCLFCGQRAPRYVDVWQPEENSPESLWLIQNYKRNYMFYAVCARCLASHNVVEDARYLFVTMIEREQAEAAERERVRQAELAEQDEQVTPEVVQ